MTEVISPEQWGDWFYDQLRRAEAFPPPVVTEPNTPSPAEEETGTSTPQPNSPETVSNEEDNNPPEPPDYEDPGDQ